MRSGYVAIGLMSLVIVGLLFLHYYRNREEGVTSMTYEEFQRIW